jgi:hemerythrin-like domain-containing protein
MKTTGYLMIEHRLIERLIHLFPAEVQRLTMTRTVDLGFLDSAADFIRTYADRTHHRKEEEILFRELGTRDLAPDDRALMDQLVAEHEVGRATVRRLVSAGEAARGGDEAALAVICEALGVLAEFYPEHIRKEDTLFFPASTRYLSEPEQEVMLHAFWESDRKMIHEKYASAVDQLEQAGRSENASGRR